MTRDHVQTVRSGDADKEQDVSTDEARAAMGTWKVEATTLGGPSAWSKHSSTGLGFGQRFQSWKGADKKESGPDGGCRQHR